MRRFPALLTVLLVLMPGMAHEAAEELVSPFNGRALELSGDAAEYSFLVGGHLYGDAGNARSPWPAASLLAGLDSIHASGASFFVSLGDNVRRADEAQFRGFQQAFAERLGMPLFTAPGNHDLADRPLYERLYGPTWGSFRRGRELYLLLDTELDSGRIDGGQREWFLGRLAEAAENPGLDRVFVFSHKLIWADRPGWESLAGHINSRRGYDTSGHFARHIESAVAQLATRKSVYWLSGDIGVSWSLPLFYERDTDTGVVYAAVGLGDTENDCLLQVSVSVANGARFSALHLGDPGLGNRSLAGETARPVEEYGLGHWREHFAPHRSDAREPGLPERWAGKAARCVLHPYFGTGLVAGTLLIALAVLIRKRH